MCLIVCPCAVIQRDKTVANTLMFIPNENIQNYQFCRLQLEVKTLDTQRNESNNKNLLKSPKLFSQQIRKQCYKTLGTMSSLSLYGDLREQMNMK